MDDFAEITRALKYESDPDDGNLLVDNDIDDVVGVDKYETLNNRVIMLTNENLQLKERVDALEAKIVPMFLEFNKSAPRSRVSVRDPDAFRSTGSNASIGSDRHISAHEGQHREHDRHRERSSPPTRTPTPQRRYTGGSRDAGYDSFAYPSPSPDPNPFVSYTTNMNSGQSMFKSNSAVAPQGYTQKANVWGTALASLMAGAARYYATKRPTGMTMVDEPKMAKVYTSICPALYEAAMCKPLPGVKEPSTFYLANAISRISKTDTPVSHASDWLLMESCQEGRYVMSVLRIMVQTAKLVPEAMVHPVSQLLPYMRDELVTQVERDNEMVAVFAISSQVDVRQTPDQWERWCGILKKNAIVKYVKYRTSGKRQTESVHKMTSEMKASELAEKSNWSKLTDLGPCLSG